MSSSHKFSDWDWYKEDGSKPKTKKEEKEENWYDTGNKTATKNIKMVKTAKNSPALASAAAALERLQSKTIVGEKFNVPETNAAPAILPGAPAPQGAATNPLKKRAKKSDIVSVSSSESAAVVNTKKPRKAAVLSAEQVAARNERLAQGRATAAANRAAKKAPSADQQKKESKEASKQRIMAAMDEAEARERAARKAAKPAAKAEREAKAAERSDKQREKREDRMMKAGEAKVKKFIRKTVNELKHEAFLLKMEYNEKAMEAEQYKLAYKAKMEEAKAEAAYLKKAGHVEGLAREIVNSHAEGVERKKKEDMANFIRHIED